MNIPITLWSFPERLSRFRRNFATVSTDSPQLKTMSNFVIDILLNLC